MSTNMIGQKVKINGGNQIGTITGYFGWGRNLYDFPIVRYIWILWNDATEELMDIKKCHIL